MRLRKHPHLLITMIAGGILLTGCSALRNSNRSPCLDRDGACFDAKIDLKPVVLLDDRSRLSTYTATEHAILKHRLEETKWTVTEPVDGALKVSASPNELGKGWFGSHGGYEIEILPLQGQEIASTPQLAESKSVNVGGKPSVQRQNVVTQSRLPKGDYLVRIKLEGPSNWDRKTVFVTIK